MEQLIGQAKKNGSLRISAPLTIIDENGNRQEMQENVYLCRCGSSKNKPFCDGTHKVNGFEAPEFQMVREQA